LLRETKGCAIAVETEEAMQAVATLARLEGLFPCPESATVVAGLKRGLESGDIGKDERVVLMATGSAMKSTPILSAPEAKRVAPGDDL
jgi:threonine synthase